MKIQFMKFWLVVLILYPVNNILFAQEEIPPLNQEIIHYVQSVIGKRVDRGECWDLANQALTRINATWDHQYKYGKAVNPKKDTIYPGDIIQFKNVRISYRKGNTIFRESMTHHTAIVYKVIKPGVYQIAHQNTSETGRKVGISNLDLSTVTSGKLYFYRPQE